MSLVTNVQDLATRVATEIKALRTLVNGNAADNSALITTAKGNLVAAINEVAASVANASGIDDTTTSGTTAWSSTKTSTEINARVAAVIDSAPGALDTLNELAAALGDDANFAATINAALGNRVRFDAAQTLTADEQAQARANVGAGTSNLVIGTTAGTAMEGNKTFTAAEVGAAPAAHTHSSTDISDATATGRSLLTAGNEAAARTAIGAGTSNVVIGTTTGTAADAAEIGNTATNFVTTFEAGLV